VSKLTNHETTTSRNPTSIAGREAWLSAASFWQPTHFVTTAWLRHAPFASWVVEATRPRAIAELGTHWGYSYFVFCEAVKRLGLDTRAFALDTWEGEEHAGKYGEEVYDYVRGVNESEYSEFSTMLRGYFDDSLSDVEDGSIDLLHIDGRHRLEDVTHDYESWAPKLSPRGVVLFHDISEHRDDFGVWEFWADISQRYRSFAFEHEHGLGVLGVGSELPPAIERFFDAAEADPQAIRDSYEALGEVVADVAALHEEARDLKAALDAERAQATKDVDARDADILGLNNQLAALHSSTSWKVTRPLRSVTEKLRPGR
jgi:hypothetical protein